MLHYHHQDIVESLTRNVLYILQSIYYLDNLRDVELKLGGIFHIDFKCLRKAKNYHLVKGYVIPLREAIMKGEDIRKYWSIKISLGFELNRRFVKKRIIEHHHFRQQKQLVKA